VPTVLVCLPLTATAKKTNSASFEPYFAGTSAFTDFSAKRWTAASQGFEQWVKENPRSPHKNRARLLQYTAALYGGDATQAATGLESLVGVLPLLNDYVRLLAADARHRQGLSGRALRHLDAIRNENFAQHQKVSQLRAQTFVQMERYRPAAQQYEQHLADYPDSSARLLFNAIDTYKRAFPTRKADQARLLRAIIARFPHTDSARKADRRLKELPRKFQRFTVTELRKRLNAQYKGQWHQHARTTANELQRRTARGSDAWCDAGFKKVRILEKQKKWGAASTGYGDLVPKCEHSSMGVDILYFGAKRRMTRGLAPGALKWFRKMRTLAPTHRYVDDTLRWEGQILRGQGHEARAEAMLRQVVDFEGGDMAEDAAWDLVWNAVLEGKLKKAARLAEQMVDRVGWEAKSYTSGRLLYWLGRIEQRRGKRVRAAQAYGRCVRSHPHSYYGLIAAQRLQTIDKKAAKRALAEAQQASGIPSILQANRKRLKSKDMQRAVSLLRMGLMRFARAELAAQGLGSGKDSDGDWLLSLLYNHVEDYTRSVRAGLRHPTYAQHPPTGNHRERWELAHPRPQAYRAAVRRAARDHGVDEALVWAVMRTESHFRPTALSHATAVGLMQLIVPTAKAMARQEGIPGPIDRHRLQDPSLSIRLGTRYLGKLSRRFDGHPALIAAGYNAGPGGPRKWLRRWPNAELDEFVERIPYREARRYAKVVVTAMLRYRQLSGHEQAPNLAFRLPSVE